MNTSDGVGGSPAPDAHNKVDEAAAGSCGSVAAPVSEGDCDEVPCSKQCLEKETERPAELREDDNYDAGEIRLAGATPVIPSCVPE